MHPAYQERNERTNVGLLARILGVLPSASKPITGPPASDSVGASPYWAEEPLLTITGTMTFGHDAIVRLLKRRSLPQRSLVQDVATLQREPGNAVDRHAVVVLLDGEQIGYLPSWAAQRFTMPTESSCQVPVQLFTAPQEGKIRSQAHVWLGAGQPKWTHNDRRWPALTREEKRRAEHNGRRDMVADALSGGGRREAEFRAGMVNGVHYLELVEPIKDLKRQGRLEEALVLCYAAIEGAESDSRGREPAPFYTDQAAIILRKLKRPEEEAAVLRRYVDHTPASVPTNQKFLDRLAKLE